MNSSYTLGQEDLIRFNLFHLTKHPKSRRAIRIQQAIIIVLLLCYVGIAVARQDLPLPLGIGLFFLAAAIGLPISRHPSDEENSRQGEEPPKLREEVHAL